MTHYLSEYETFENKYELNNAIYEHIKRNTHELNETDRVTLKMISRYAVKFAGVAHLKAITIAGLIDKSEKTARRVINKLASLGIVKKIETGRKVSGGKGANIIVIQPLESVENSSSDQSQVSSREVYENAPTPTVEDVKIESEPSDLIKRIKSTKDTLKGALKDVIPSAVYDNLSPYMNDEELYRYYGILLKAKKNTVEDLYVEECPQPFIESIRAVMFQTKRGNVRNLPAYFYNAMAKASTQACRLLSEGKMYTESDIIDLYSFA